MNISISYRKLLEAFYAVDELNWIQLCSMFASAEPNALAKKKLADMIVDLIKNKMIEKLGGLPMKWRITETGRDKIKALLHK